MRATAEPLEGNLVRLSVEIDEPEFDRALGDVVRSLARQVRVPGFRPGKVPIPIVKQRYGKLLEILSSRMDEKTLNETLHELGTYCSSLGDERIKKFRGDFDGFCKAIKQSLSGDIVTYDREKGVITMDSGERTDCFCPLIGRLYNTPKVACNCSLGWQQHTWETLLGKKVHVELKESVLRGGKRCLFEIRVGDVPPAKATS